MRELLSGNKMTDLDLTQLINGEEYMVPSPNTYHQKIIMNLIRLFDEYLQNNPTGEIFVSPLDVILKEGVNRLQPDLIFIKNENLDIVQDWIQGVPDLVVEVVSQGTVTMDTITKKDIYEKYRVPEFWLVYPAYALIEVLVMEGSGYRLHASSENQNPVSSRLLTGLSMETARIFTS